MTRIGTHKIILPNDSDILGVDKGLAMAEEHVTPYTEDIVAGRFSLHLIVPEERPMMIAGRRTIKPTFYAGVFEALFTETLTRKFPDARAFAKRAMLSEVGSARENPVKAAQSFFDKCGAVNTAFTPFEDFIFPRVQVGVRDGNGQDHMAVMASDGSMCEVADKHMTEMLYFWSWGLAKALDTMYLTDFSVREQHQRALKLVDRAKVEAPSLQ